jgi:hypothetical protein
VAAGTRLNTGWGRRRGQGPPNREYHVPLYVHKDSAQQTRQETRFEVRRGPHLMCRQAFPMLYMRLWCKTGPSILRLTGFRA